MTTPPYGETDPLRTSADSSTPIGDELAYDSGLDPALTSDPAPLSTPASTGFSDGSDFSDSSGSSAESAKDTAQQALGSASDHASDVAGTAKDEAVKVASEAKDKATDLLADVKTQVDEQSKTQLQNLSSKLAELADEIHYLVSGSEKSGAVTDVAQQLADKTHQLSSHLESREPLDLLEDFRGYARRRPAAFLAGAAVAGVLAGRLTRGAKASSGTGSPEPAAGSIGDPPTVTSTPTTGGAFPAPDFVPAGQNTGGRQ